MYIESSVDVVHSLYLQVSPPGLHISLGIFFRLFTLLEDECHALDVAHSLGLQGSTAGSTFITFTTALQRQCTLRDNIDRLSSQIQALEQLLTLVTVTLAPGMPQMTTFTQQLVDELSSVKARKHEMV